MPAEAPGVNASPAPAAERVSVQVFAVNAGLTFRYYSKFQFLSKLQ
jgi:hypothetical protein